MNQRNMIVGIDASNLRTGGGAVPLMEMLRIVQPQEYGFNQVIVWGGRSILEQIEDKPWLLKVREPMLNMLLFTRLLWQRSHLDQLARLVGCNILFIPGGTHFGSFRLFVTMCQNMLPFEWLEARRYGISWFIFKYLLLRKTQITTFRNANGLIFLSEYAHTAISPLLKGTIGKRVLIPHGMNERFRKEPRPQKPISTYSAESPFRLFYVSSIVPYKHQWYVMEAVYKLRQLGLPLVLEFSGPIDSSGKKFFKALYQLDPKGEWIHYLGGVSYLAIQKVYQDADLFVFTSSCENMPNFLLEAMATGLPIASSNRGPMPSILDRAAVYFDPENPSEIANVIKTLIEDPHLREEISWEAYKVAKPFT